MKRFWLLLSLVFATFHVSGQTSSGVRLKDMARIDAGHESALVGYGIVVGLAGSGDSARNNNM